MTRRIFLLFSVLVASAVFPFSSSAFAAGDSATIIFVRHAEKAATSGDVPLNAEGRQRADLLAWMLKPAGVTHIFTSQMMRTRETAAPTARATQVEPEAIRAEDIDTLVMRLKKLPPDAVALVVGHSSSVPQIIERLGAGKIAPIEETDFDRLVVVIRSSDRFQAVTLQYGGIRNPAQSGR